MGEVGDFNTGVTGRRLLGPPKQGLLGRHILLTNNNIRDLEKNENKILVQTYEILICIFANTKMTSNKNAHTLRHHFFTSRKAGQVILLVLFHSLSNGF